MKRIITNCLAIIMTASVFAQIPNKMNYQAVIRDESNKLITYQSVGMKISILQGSVSGTAVYVEIYNPNPSTNVNGLVTVEIGGGVPLSGNITTIDWSAGPYFIKTETDPSGGTNYTISGISQLLSVPYALHAKTAEIITGTISESDPIYSGSQAAKITTTDITNLDNLSGLNTGDQDISALATKKELVDSLSQVRSDIPDVSSFLTNETDPTVPSGTQTGEMQYWNGSIWVTIPPGYEGQSLNMVDGIPAWLTPGVNDVENPTTGKTWMDRNLGASRVALSTNDVAAYGDLYQWGRGTDGHEIRTSGTTSNLSSSDTPAHGNFIFGGSGDWRSPQNDNLWQGVSGINNPCPTGYRLPTKAEWDAELLSWITRNAAGAFASPLKLPMAGFRGEDGSLKGVGFYGYYRSSNVVANRSPTLSFGISGAGMYDEFRVYGISVRCLKD